jgi:hypothetical protein
LEIRSQHPNSIGILMNFLIELITETDQGAFRANLLCLSARDFSSGRIVGHFVSIHSEALIQRLLMDFEGFFLGRVTARTRGRQTPNGWTL